MPVVANGHILKCQATYLFYGRILVKKHQDSTQYILVGIDFEVVSRKKLQQHFDLIPTATQRRYKLYGSKILIIIMVIELHERILIHNQLLI